VGTGKMSAASIDRTRDVQTTERGRRSHREQWSSPTSRSCARPRDCRRRGRCCGSFPLPATPHAATSATLAGAYPFLAEAGLGSRGILIGTDLLSGGSFVYDPWELYHQGVLTNPNALLAGVIGTGKSALAKSIATRSLAFGTRVYVPGDPKGEWTPATRAAGGTAIILGQGQPTRLNPLDEGNRPVGLTDPQWEAMVWTRRRDLLGVLTETVLGRPLQPVEHTALDAALTAATRTAAVPTLPDVVAYLLDPTTDAGEDAILRVEGRDVAHALRRMVHGDLSGLFDGPSTVRFDPNAPMVSLDLSGVTGNDTLLSLVMTCASTWMETAILDPTAAAAGSSTTRPGASCATPP